MSWRDAFHEAVAEYLRDRHWSPVDAVTVIDVEEDIPSPYYCETCGPDSYTVTVTYIDSQGKTQRTSVYATLTEFMGYIT